jgi:hypothetical protein
LEKKMSPTFKPLSTIICVGVMASGLTLVACSPETPADTDKSHDEPEGESDTGKQKDAGKDAGKSKDAGTAAAQGVPGEDCDSKGSASCEDCAEERCTTKCEDGVWGECLPATSRSADAGTKPQTGGNTGLPDGSTVVLGDGSVSVKVGDASIAIQGMDCPTPFLCSNKSMSLAAPAIMALSGGAPVCVGTQGLGAPPNCTAVADCTMLGFKQAVCQPDPSGVLGGSICLQICK